MLKKSIILILLFSFLVVQPGCGTTESQKEEAYNHFQMGLGFMRQGKYPQSLKHFLVASEINPGHSHTWNQLGLVYFFQKEYERSIVSFNEALSIDKAFSEAHNNLARVYIEIKNYPLAKKHLDIAAKDLTYSNKDKVWLNYGLSQFNQNKFGKAKMYFLKSISTNRKNCMAYNYYGRTLVEQENFKHAAKSLDKAIYHCQKKGFAQPHYYSAISLFRLGYKSKAIARLNEGMKLYPKSDYNQKMNEMLELMKITNTK